VPLYRIAYVFDSQAHSVVRELPLPPVPGDELALDAITVVAVREVVSHPEGDTISAEIVAETLVGEAIDTTPRVTGSGSRNSR
jgi:hypothetical protein